MNDFWICDSCLRVFLSDWLDSEAQAECLAICGPVPLSRQVILCDPCCAIWHHADRVDGQPTSSELLTHWVIDTDHYLTQLVAA